MTSRRRLLPRALAALAVAASALLGASAAPAAADPGSCTPSVGVVVVVDFRPFGGGIERGCDPAPTTGFAAVHTAGFPTVGTQHDGPGFVCRIKGLPTAAADPCVVTPPSTRYWSYWHADAGQSGWSYSQVGAASYRPKAGSVDAWVYGATDVGGTTGGPSFSPSSVRATAPTAAPSPSSSAGTGAGPGGGGSTGSGGGAAGSATRPPSAGATTARPGTTGTTRTPGASSASPPSPSSAPASGATPAAPTAASTSSGSAAAPEPSTTAPTSTPSTASTSDTSAPTDATTPASTDPPVTDVRAAPTAVETSTGSVWPTVGVAVLLVAVGTGAVVMALRRRRAES